MMALHRTCLGYSNPNALMSTHPTPPRPRPVPAYLAMAARALISPSNAARSPSPRGAERGTACSTCFTSQGPASGPRAARYLCCMKCEGVGKCGAMRHWRCQSYDLREIVPLVREHNIRCVTTDV